MKNSNIIRNLAAAAGLATLVACGGGGSCPSNLPQNGQLVFVAPSILPSLANKTGINYMGVYNPSTVAINGISYNLGQQVGSGNSITLDKDSAKACASIPAQSSCFLKFSVPESTIAGGGVVTATNSSGQEAATPLAIGVQQVPYSESANADGVGLYFYPKAQYSSTGVPFILVTAVVQSPNVGNINTVQLVDESGNVIPDQEVISGNSGAGKPALSMGDVVEISLPIPQGVNLSQKFKVQVSNQGLVSSALNTLANKLNLKSLETTTGNISTATYTLTTQGNNINLQLTPNQVYLTQTNPVQYGYLYNIGDLTASQIKLTSSSPNVRVTVADAILNGQRVIKVTYELLDTTVSASFGTVTVTANNPTGESQTSTGGTSQNVNPLPVPTPNPTPTPSPTVSPTSGPEPHTADLNLSLNSVTLNSTYAQRTITVTNAGNADATNLVLPVLSSPIYLYENTTTCIAGQTLAPNASCTYTVSYPGATVAGSENVTFGYSGGTASIVPLTIDWAKATQWAYLVRNDFNNPGVYKCTLSASGDISGCIQQANSMNIVRGRDLTFNLINDIKYLYVADYQAGGIFKCTLSAAGNIDSCTDITASTPAAGIEAGYIVFGTVNNIQYAYFTDTNNHELFTCKVKSDGNFENCSQTSFDYLYGISFANIDETPYLYVNTSMSSTQGLLRFPLNTTDGQPIINEVQTLLDYNNYDSGLDIYKFNGVRYLYTGYTGPVGSSWTLSTNGSSVSNQVDFQNISNLPYSINFTTPTNMSPYGYVQSTGGIYKCDVNQAAGALTNCANTTAAMGVSVAFSIFAVCDPCSIFTTASTTANGILGQTWNDIDNLCMADSNKPNDGLTYKAMLVGDNNGVQRQACTSANCTTGGSSENINWVLHPNTIYNWAGTTNQVFTTNSTGIAPMPIPNQGAPSSAVLWTGLNQDWTTDSANTCSGWTSTSGNGRLGNRAAPNGNFIGAITRACSDNRQLLYCVSQ